MGGTKRETGWVRGIPGLKIQILSLRSRRALGHPLFVLDLLGEGKSKNKSRSLGSVGKHFARDDTSLGRGVKSKCNNNRRSFDYAALAQDDRSLIWVRGLPPLRQKEVAKMGHGAVCCYER